MCVTIFCWQFNELLQSGCVRWAGSFMFDEFNIALTSAYYYCISSIICSIIWWSPQMQTFSALLTPYAGNSPVTGEQGKLRWTLMFSLICTWTNVWVNNRDAGELTRHRSHYDCNEIWSCVHVNHHVILYPLEHVYHQLMQLLPNVHAHKQSLRHTSGKLSISHFLVA